MKQTYIFIQEDLKEEIEQASKETGLSISDMANKAIFAAQNGTLKTHKQFKAFTELEKLQKPARLNLRLSNLSRQILERQEFEQSTYLRYALLSMIKSFEKCPNCQVAMFHPSYLVKQGVFEMKCKNGHTANYDFKTNKFQ